MMAFKTTGTGFQNHRHWLSKQPGAGFQNDRNPVFKTTKTRLPKPPTAGVPNHPQTAHMPAPTTYLRLGSTSGAPQSTPCNPPKSPQNHQNHGPRCRGWATKSHNCISVISSSSSEASVSKSSSSASANTTLSWQQHAEGKRAPRQWNASSKTMAHAGQR